MKEEEGKQILVGLQKSPAQVLRPPASGKSKFLLPTLFLSSEATCIFERSFLFVCLCSFIIFV